MKVRGSQVAMNIQKSSPITMLLDVESKPKKFIPYMLCSDKLAFRWNVSWNEFMYRNKASGQIKCWNKRYYFHYRAVIDSVFRIIPQFLGDVLQSLIDLCSLHLVMQAQGISDLAQNVSILHRDTDIGYSPVLSCSGFLGWKHCSSAYFQTRTWRKIPYQQNLSMRFLD